MSSRNNTTNVKNSGKVLTLAGRDVRLRNQNVIVKNMKQINRRTIIYNRRNSRRNIPSNPAIGFLLNRIRGRDDTSDIAYDERARRPMTISESDELTEKLNLVWVETLVVLDELEEAMEAFKKRIWGEETLEDFTASESVPPWEEVIGDVRKELKEARRIFKTGYLRQTRSQSALVSLDEDLDACTGWIKSLPSDELPYTLCTAFKLLFKAVAGNYRLDDLIFKALAKVVRMFSDAKYYTALCSQDRLTTSLEEQSATLLETFVALLIQFLQYTGKGKPTENEITQTVDKMMYRLRDMNMEAKRDGQISRPLGSKGSIEGHPLLDVLGMFMDFLNSSPYAHDQPPWANTDASSSTAQSDLLDKKAHRNIDRTGFNASDLIDRLSYNSTTTTRNIEECLSNVYIEANHMRQLSSLTQLDTFKKWLFIDPKRPTSSALLIHGNFDQVDVHSPLSYLTARIAREYSEINCVAALSYFCGLRTDKWDPRANAAGIVCDMVGQLLSHPKLAFFFDLGFIHQNCIRKIEKNDLVELCKLFLELVHQLRQERVIIFCMIDSISIYETKALREDTQRLLSTLQDMVHSYRGGRGRKGVQLVFKLLLTEATSTKYACKTFKSGDVLEMSEDFDEGNEEDLETGI